MIGILPNDNHFNAINGCILKDSKYLLEAMISHLVDLRRMNVLRDGELKKIEEPLALAFANLRGGSHSDKVNEKRRQLARLGRERLMIEVKRARD